MAIYHMSVNVISRGRGQSIVAAAAYRSGALLRDERYGMTHNYLRRTGVAHSEIMSPVGAPDWARERETLWNRVEACEARKDSQLARVIEVGLPIELTADECVALMRDYIAVEFVAQGMIADFCIRRDNPDNPRAHILLTLRPLLPAGFGPKERRWNGKATLLEWRAAWADRANEHLARAGHAVRIDHRTLEAQQVELTPGRNLGLGGARPADAATNLPAVLIERITDQQRIAQHNGDLILEDPTVAIHALSQQQPSFTHADLAAFLRSRTAASQFDAAYLAVTRSAELVALRSNGGPERFTSRDMIEAAKSLRQRAVSMAGRRGHGIAPERRHSVSAQVCLDAGQQRVFDYLASEGDAKAVAVEDADQSALLKALRLAWEAAGLRVAGVARSRASAERLAAASGMTFQTLASLEEEWRQGRGALTRNEVLLVEGAEMIALKPLERLLAAADRARAKAALIGNAEQLRAMRTESPFGGVLLEIGLPERPVGM